MGHGNLRFPVRPPPFYYLGGLRPPPLRGLPLPHGRFAPSLLLLLVVDISVIGYRYICHDRGYRYICHDSGYRYICHTNLDKWFYFI